MIKYIAKQIDPEFQRNNLFWGSSFEDDYYNENCFICGNSRYFCNINLDRFKLPTDELEGLTREEIIAKLKQETGKEWECVEIRGCSQSEWNVLYYVKDSLNQSDIDYVESCYFNTGMEFRLEEVDNKDEIFTIYIPLCMDGEIKELISNYSGYDEEEIEVLLFDGYHRTPKYKKL